MSVYKCIIATPEGHSLSKTIIADSVAALKEKVAQEGNFLVDAKKSAGEFSFLSFSAFITPKTFISFNYEFSVLLKSGMPIVAALDVLIKKENNNRFQSLLNDIRTDISNGDSLSTAFSKHEHIFSPIYTATLKAGESNGTVPQSISKYIDDLKRAQTIKQKVKSASVYPLILIIASLFVVIFLLIFVVPVLTSSFSDSGSKLPFITLVLLNTSSFIKERFLWIILIFIMFAVFLRIFIKSEDGKKFIHKFILYLPYFSILIKYYSIARFSSTLSSLLSSGFALNNAVRTSALLVGNQYIRSNLIKIVDEIEKGERFSDTLKQAKIFDELAVSMITAGEHSGSLENILLELSSLYENELENMLLSITSMIEPILMVIMGFIIGFIVLALYMPIFELAGTI